MNKRRLLKLANLLETDAKNKKGTRFDLSLWADVSDRKKPISCGTTVCAMGLAAISGIFKRAGLTYRIDNGFWFSWHGDNLDGFEIATELFDIPYNDASQLFSHTAYSLGQQTGARGELAVAKRIRKLCDQHRG